ncbi:MAG: acyltransferase [Solirubrobacteraceae bacterium]|nr:acyltransferase [Solirubrobacteraceae bacterium]
MTDATATDERAGAQPAVGDGLIGTLDGGDGLRAIAALMVFLGHVFVNADPGEAFESYGWAKEVVGRLDLGLGLFFALSGYFIARPFVRSYILGTQRPSVPRFARNRALRIVPAFYVIAALVLLRFGLDGAIGPTPDNPSGTAPPSEWWQVVSIFTFTQSYTGGSATLPYGQAWSLNAEMAFYALLPLAALLGHRLGGRVRTTRARAYAALAVIGGAGLVSIYLRQGGGSFAALTSPPLIFYAFVPGIMLAAAEPLAAPLLRGNPRRARRLAWALVALVALSWAAYASWDYAVQTTALHGALGRRALMAVICAGAALAAVIVWQLGTERAPRWLTNRPIRYLGARSYAFYLLHVWIIFEVIDLVGADAGTTTLVIAMIALGLPATLALAALSWRFVERPFLERRVRWALGERRPGPGAPAPAPAAAATAIATAGPAGHTTSGPPAGSDPGASEIVAVEPPTERSLP